MIRLGAKILTLAMLLVLLSTAMPNTTVAQDDTEALRERILTAWEATLDYESGVYTFEDSNSNSSNIALTDGTAFTSADSSNYTGTHTFSYDDNDEPNVQSLIGYGYANVSGQGESTTTVSESVAIELRLVEDVLYLNAEVVAVDGSDLTVPEGWFILSDAFSEEDLNVFGEDLPTVFGGIDYSFFDFEGETDSYANFIRVIESATALTSSEGTDSAGNPVEVITIEVDGPTYIATALGDEDMTEEDMAITTMIFENAILSITVSLNADGNIVAGDATVSTVFSTTDLATMGFPEGTTGTFDLAISTTSTFEYSQINEAFTLIEAPADAIAFE